MTTQNLFQRGGLRWHPDSDAVNAPEGVLLVADNLVPDKEGALALRRGSSQSRTSLGTDVTAIYTAPLSGTMYQGLSVDDDIYVDGVRQTNADVDGTGDIAMGDDAYQMFFARGTTRKKYDPTAEGGSGAFYNWSIGRPVAAPTLVAVASITSTIADFNNSESPACAVMEGSGAIGGASDQAAAANEATTINPDGSTFQAILKRLWTTDQDFFTLSGTTGSETDLVDLYVKFERPRNVETVTLIFGLDDSSTLPFQTDRFEFEFDIRNGEDIPIKDAKAEGYAAYEESVLKSVSSVLPQEVTGIRSPLETKATLDRVGDKPSPKTSGPSDNEWGHLTVTRGQFKRIGSTATRGWNTVRGFKLVYKTIKGKAKNSSLTVSDAIFIGGGDRTLTGTFRCVIRGVRNTGQYYEMGPPSAQSAAINLNHQTLQITVPGTTLSALDPQCNQVWIYLFGGWLDGYYRFATVGSAAVQGMTIDELTTPDGSNMDDADERSRITGWGMTMQDASASTDITLTLRVSELDALTANVRLEPYQMEAPNNIIDIAGPWKGRMMCLTSEGYMYPSTRTSPGSFNSLHLVDLSRYGDAHWIARTGSGVYVGMSEDVIFMAGSGQESPDLALIDLYGEPLHIGNPPIDSSHYVDGNTIIYRSADGLMMLSGGNLRPLDMAGTSLLWRGQERHGVEALNVSSGRFRFTVDNQMFYMLAPEGDDTAGNVIYRYSFQKEQWSRLYYPQVTTEFNSLYTEPDGTLLAGDGAGVLWELDVGSADNNIDIPILIRTPIEDSGDPLTAKDAFDLQLHGYTGGASATVNLYKDGDGDYTTTYQAAMSQRQPWRTSLSGFGSFIKAQLELEGSFNEFVLSQWNLAYRARPQRMAYVDTGYFVSEGDITWVYEIEVDVNPTGDFTVDLYFNDVLHSSHAVSANVGVRDVYQIPVARGAKGELPRIVVRDDTTYGTDNGFDLYRVRIRAISSGNEDSNRTYMQVYPAGPAS